MPRKPHKHFVAQQVEYYTDVLFIRFNPYDITYWPDGSYMIGYIEAGHGSVLIYRDPSFQKANAVWEFLRRNHSSVWKACAVAASGLNDNLGE